MTEELLDRGDPVIRRLQQAFAHEELTTELAAIMQRAARYQTGESPPADDQPAPGDGVPEADLVAARRRAPFAGLRRKSMARVFLADCQPLFNEALEALITRDGTNEVVGQASAVPQIVASVPQLKPDLFVLDAGLALSTRPTVIETILAELPDTKVILLAQDTDIDLLLHAIRAGAVGVVGKKSGTQTVLRAVQAVLDGEGVVPRAMLPQLFRRLLDMGDRATDAPLNRLSPREREVLALLGRGWSNAQIGRELYISPHTVRTHVQNILQKLEMHSKLEAATFAMQHELATRRPTATDVGRQRG
jgi:DNA-binding NarL/FixJ family response regulator